VKRLFIASVVLLLLARPLAAADWTAIAVPVRIDLVQEEGFMIYGEFQNPGNCAVEDRVFVKFANANYNQIYAAVLTAMAKQYTLQLYVNGCESLPWYALPGTTFNVVSSQGAVILAPPP
jgi:hypothetical protein